MIKDPLVYLVDILESITQIQEYVGGLTRQEFNDNELIQDAVIRRLEIIGEATKRLDDDFRHEFPQIPWKNMTGLRDVLAHDYSEVDLDQIWLVIKDDLPGLEQNITSILESKQHE